MTALDHARSCGAPLSASLFGETILFAGVFDSYRAHTDPLEQAETRMVACVRRAIRVRFGHAVPTPVPPPGISRNFSRALSSAPPSEMAA